MPAWPEDSLTPRQRQWFAAVREGLERDTGRSLADWAEIARACPETRPRARQAWLKTHYGLAQNRAALVLSAAFPQPADAEPPALWTTPEALAIYQAVETAALALPDVVVGPRKTFTAFSRKVQFAAAAPLKGGAVALGLALPPDADQGLEPAGRAAWSERLKSRRVLRAPDEVDAALAALLRHAWEGA